MIVFVTSTVFDLIDVRSEIRELLTSAGLYPVMSDDGTSGFRQIPSVNSIETCLIHLRTADCCIVILSQRYGSSLAQPLPDYGDISATHLEYRVAMQEGKDVFFYVRDKLLTEFNLWRRHKSPSDLDGFPLNWTPRKDALRIFRFLEERSKLELNAKNWAQPFTDSCHLKKLISNDLNVQIHLKSFRDQIVNGQVPSLILVHELNSDNETYLLSIFIDNCSKYPAFAITIHSDSIGDKIAFSFISPQERLPLANLEVTPGTASAHFSITYHTALGFRIEEDYRLMCSEGATGVAMVSIERTDHRFSIPHDLRDQFVISY